MEGEEGVWREEEGLVEWLGIGGWRCVEGGMRMREEER